MASPHDEAFYWESQLDELRRSGLKTVRDAAAKWQGLIAGFLSVFGAASFIKGPSTFKDLGLDAQTAGLLVVVVLMGAVLGLAALYLTGLASFGMPQIRTSWTGKELEAWTQQQAVRSIRWLAIGHGLTVAAALIVFVGSIVVLLLPFRPQATPAVWAVAKRAHDGVVCGRLTRATGLQLVIGNQIFDLEEGDSITIVDRCPE